MTIKKEKERCWGYAKKYNGLKIKKIWTDEFKDLTGYEDEIHNIAGHNNMKELKNSRHSIVDEMDGTYNLKEVENNLILYKCEIYKTNDLAELCNIRDKWNKYKKFNYTAYFTENEIKNMLKNNCVVAVKGCGEIDLDNIY
ncbi:MAG: hypothetical protein ACOCRX_10600 [Candidatus Woesearchaeota archaeon]